MQATADAELSRTGLDLTFPSALEARYQSDTESERVLELRAIVRLGAVLYLVGGLVVKPLLTVPAPWPVSVLQQGRVAASLFLLSRRYFRIGTSGAACEAALLACCDSPGSGGALLLIDVDRFKDFNDRLGHLDGDECLRQIAARLSMHLRRPDLMARFGGEEFAVLLPQVSSDEATQMTERLRKAVSAQPFLVDGQSVSLKVSIGVAVRGRGCDPDGLIGAADRSLYAAKNSGRDQVKAAAVAA